MGKRKEIFTMIDDTNFTQSENTNLLQPIVRGDITRTEFIKLIKYHKISEDIGNMVYDSMHMIPWERKNSMSISHCENCTMEYMKHRILNDICQDCDCELSYHNSNIFDLNASIDAEEYIEYEITLLKAKLKYWQELKSKEIMYCPKLISHFDKIALSIREINKANGWKVLEEREWADSYKVPGILALIHSEVSEGLEAFRKNDRENFAEEMADVIIRVLDCTIGLNIDIESEIMKKLEKNKKRAFRHGGKRV